MMLKKANGFTIIEMLVVMFIIGVLATLVLTNYRSGQNKYALEQAAQKLVSDIRRAQNMSMGGVGISASSGRRGYGLSIEKGATFYIIYADKSGNLSFQGQPPDEIVETIYLSNKIKIQNVSPVGPRIHIFFRPPEPTTFINGKDNIGGLGTITLEVEDTSLTKTVTVTTAGLIYSN